MYKITGTTDGRYRGREIPTPTKGCEIILDDFIFEVVSIKLYSGGERITVSNSNYIIKLVEV